MGATNSNIPILQNSDYDRLKFIREVAPNRFLLQDPLTSEQFISVENTFPSQDLMVKFSNQFKAKNSCLHQYYLSPCKHFLITSNNLCSKQHKFIQIFSFEDYSLYDEIVTRIEQKRDFNEKEIWSILCSCVLAMAHFTRNDIHHLTLNPKDIVLNASGQVKILATELSDYQFDYTFKRGFYYAPQILKVLKNSSPFSHNHCNKPAVFTLGMTILSAITKEDLSSVYNEDCSLDYSEILHLLDRIKMPQINQILRKMVKPAPYDRISFPELEEMLYNILEQSEDFSQASQLSQQNEFERLEDSIYRVKLNTETNENEPDVEDNPNQEDNGQFFVVFDQQVMDEEPENAKKFKNQFQQTKNTFNTHLQNPLKEATTKINNIYASSEQNSLQIMDQKKSAYAFLSNATKTSREQGSYYVTEQYSRGKYEGYKENGMRHGFGTFYYEEGGKYCGEWVKNKMQGRGALYYSNGELAYEGEWNQDQLNGHGVLYNENPVYITNAVDYQDMNKVKETWVKYEGNFCDDMKSGDGTLFISNGEYFRGEFNYDLPNGRGVYRTVNGQLVKGSWNQGIFHSS